MIIDGNFKAFAQQVANDFAWIIYELIGLANDGGSNFDGATAGEIAALSLKVELRFSYF